MTDLVDHALTRLHRRALVARFEGGEFSSSNAAWEAASLDLPASLDDMRVISFGSTGLRLIQDAELSHESPCRL